MISLTAMAGFLRKKGKQEAKAAVPSPPVNNDPPPPLFARFASTAQTKPQERPTMPRVVSGPIALAPKRESMSHNPKKGSGPGATVVSSTAGTERGDGRRRRDPYAEKNPMGSAMPTSTHSPDHAGGVMNFSKPVSFRAQSQYGGPPTPTAASRPLKVDKPLPPPVPPSARPDPLGASPPQSSLPANRRMSTRGVPIAQPYERVSSPPTRDEDLPSRVDKTPVMTSPRRTPVTQSPTDPEPSSRKARRTSTILHANNAPHAISSPDSGEPTSLGPPLFSHSQPTVAPSSYGRSTSTNVHDPGSQSLSSRSSTRKSSVQDLRHQVSPEINSGSPKLRSTNRQSLVNDDNIARPTPSTSSPAESSLSQGGSRAEDPEPVRRVSGRTRHSMNIQQVNIFPVLFCICFMLVSPYSMGLRDVECMLSLLLNIFLHRGLAFRYALLVTHLFTSVKACSGLAVYDCLKDIFVRYCLSTVSADVIYLLFGISMRPSGLGSYLQALSFSFLFL